MQAFTEYHLWLFALGKLSKVGKQCFLNEYILFSLNLYASVYCKQIVCKLF